MSRTRLIQSLLAGGALLCIPGAVIVVLFAANAADVAALRSAPTCSKPTQDASSTCLSVFEGTATAWAPETRSFSRVTIVVEDTTVDVGYGCAISPAGACSGISGEPGSELTSEWWKGRVVAIGPPGTAPAVVTDQNPAYQLRLMVLVLVFVIPGASFVTAGILLWQAPMEMKELLKSALGRWPDPPRPVGRSLILRVAVGHLIGPVPYLVWVLAYLTGFLLVLNPEWALLVLLTTFALSLAITSTVATLLLGYAVTRGERRTIAVNDVRRGLGKSGNRTRVWYTTPNGETKSKELGWEWHRVSEGDRLEVLTGPYGILLWVVSNDGSGVGREPPSGAGLDQSPVTQPQ